MFAAQRVIVAIASIPDRQMDIQTFATSKPHTTSHECGRKLRETVLVKGNAFSYRVRQYFYQDMKEWVAHLLCQPGFEE